MWHTKQTVEALQKNELASESDLFIYCDNAKNEEGQKIIDEVRNYVDSVDGFKKVTIIKREKNWGLANSIIDGVTKIVNEYGKIIVLEDDLVTSPYFLKFMNEALEYYKNEEKVWHISGWNYPINTDGLDDVFLWQLMNCRGWATWADKWQYYEKDVDKTIKEFSKEEIKRFNLDGNEEVLDINLARNQIIDFLSIDVEGLDFDVIKSLNIKKYKPRVIIVEILGSSLSDLQDDTIYNFLIVNHYSLFAKAVNSVIFKSNTF